MKFASTFTYVNTCEQRLTANIDGDENTLVVEETVTQGKPSHGYKLYFQNRNEVTTLIEMLIAMRERMDD